MQMATRKEGFWVRVVNDQVKDCWDYRPGDGVMASQPGWREAVEVTPDITPNREYITTHHFDVTKSPVEIVWSKASLSVGDRKGSMIAIAKQAVRKVIMEQMELEMSPNSDESFDSQAVADAKTASAAKIAAINAATTHEDLDALL